jgi:hypothetical protein
MPDKTTKKHKHLTYADREEIQGCLNHGMTFKAIGQRIGKDQTTVSKEVKRHLVSQPLEHRTFDSQGKSLGGKSPFEVFAFLFGHDAAAVLGIRAIPPADVIQSPKLLRK